MKFTKQHHVHGGPAFLTWHRELCNRFEKLLMIADSNVSLHYWDWNEDPENTLDVDGNELNLFTKDFMGNSRGPANEPWLSAGFYNPYPMITTGLNPFDDEHNNPDDVPIALTRKKLKGTLQEYMEKQIGTFYSDKEIIESKNYSEMRRKLRTRT